MANAKIPQQKVFVSMPATIRRRLLRAQKIRVRSDTGNSFAELYRFMPNMFFSLKSKLRGAK